MSLNNSRGFPSILLLNFSVLCYPVAINQKQGAVSLAFLHKIFEQKYMRASVRAIEAIIKLFDFDL